MPTPAETCAAALENDALTHATAAAELDPAGQDVGTIKPATRKGCVIKCCDDFSSGPHHGSYRRNGYYDILARHASVYRPARQPVVTRYRTLTRKNPKLTDRWGNSASAVTSAFTMFPKAYGATKPDAKHVNFGPVPGRHNHWWWLDPSNKNYRGATYYPFSHNYHHMLPWKSLFDAFGTEPPDAAGNAYPSLRMLQSAGYNLNEGINLIILPCTIIPSLILGLPMHPTNHPNYNARLSAMLNDLKAHAQSRQAARAPHPIDQNNKDSVKETLENWEKRQFGEIVRHGGSSAAVASGPKINACKLVDMMCQGNLATKTIPGR